MDGLRGLAVLAVIVYHFFGDALPGGYLGVDMFFVLSGFLITSLLVREHSVHRTISLKDFWKRRFRRILPAALTVLFICTAAAKLIGGDLVVGIREQFLGTLFFVNNWVQIATSQSYFADNEIQLFAHYWSLAVEEQFYVLWPLLFLAVFAVARRRKRWLPASVTLILAVASALAMALLFAPDADPTRVYYGTDTHAFGLLLGAFLSLVVTSRSSAVDADSWPVRGKKEKYLAAAIGTLALAGYVFQLFWMADDMAITYRGGLVATSVLGIAMIWGTIHQAGPLRWIFERAPMRWLGQRSFSLYLWHWPVIMMLRAVWDPRQLADAPWVPGVVALVISGVLSEVSYRVIENPFRRRGFAATVRGFFSGWPGWSEWTGSATKAFRPLAPVILVAAIAGSVWAVSTSQDKSALELELEELAANNQAANAGDAGADEAHDSGSAASDNPAPTAKHPYPQGSEITAIGDSVMLASSAQLQERFPGIYIDAAVSRHISAAVSIIQSMAASGELRDTVFLGFGTNGAQLGDEIDQVMEAIGPDRTVVMAVPYGDRSWMPASQQEVLDAAKKYDNVYVADWCAFPLGDPAILREDGIHPGEVGATHYATAFHYALLQYTNGDKLIKTSCLPK